jgi:Zn-finger nucleic acid-binding protein
MYRGHTAPCPACSGALSPLRSAVPLSGCVSCGGMWLGPEASVHIMRGLGDALEKDVEALSADTARRSLAPVPDSGARACPTCNLVMARLVVARVTIDSCATHGTWFDPKEVENVAKACRELRRVQHPGVMMSAVNAVTGAVEQVVGAPLLAVEEIVNAWTRWSGSKRP